MPTQPAEIAVAFIEAWGRQDMTTVASYLAEDVTFEGPIAQASGAEDVLETIGGFAQLVTDVRIIAAVGDDERAMIMYDMDTRPFGTMRAVDYLVVRDGKITTDTLVFENADRVREAP